MVVELVPGVLEEEPSVLLVVSEPSDPVEVDDPPEPLPLPLPEPLPESPWPDPLPEPDAGVLVWVPLV